MESVNRVFPPTGVSSTLFSAGPGFFKVVNRREGASYRAESNLQEKTYGELMARNIDYEVALEILGRCARPFVQVRFEEYEKANPNQTLIDYRLAGMGASLDLRDDLSPDDAELIEKIIDCENKNFFGAF
ncbi:MAG: hypothetical protein LBR53_09525 [Deltaproteobacteria bacterium]|jgi:hypothetical protein|nr:hypothetical protein [Deltaproteobacteria bacterium]